MKIRFVVVSKDVRITEFISFRQGKVFPEDILERPPYSINNTSISSILWNAEQSEDDLIIKLLYIAEYVDYIVVIHDGSRPLSGRLKDAVYTIRFDPSTGGKTLHNYFFMHLARVMKRYAIFIARYNRREDSTKILLPLDNFRADSLINLRELMHVDVCEGEFAEALQHALLEIGELKRPKKRTTSKDDFYVDDSGYFFRLSFEEHAEAESKIPPHDLHCVINKKLRFGASYPNKWHFNISDEDRTKLVERGFTICHPEDGPTYKKRKNVNLFPNGCIA